MSEQQSETTIATETVEKWGDPISPERQAELQAAYEANVAAGKPPYAGVQIGTRQELSWVLLTHGWEGLLPEHAEQQGRQVHTAELNGADLGGVDLNGVLLDGAYLEGADLHGANLTNGACLEGAKLARANLCGANLQGLDARNVDLTDANLTGADLQGANLSGAKLRGAKLYGANLSEARFDVATHLADVVLDGETRLADIVWNDVPLTRVAWDEVQVLGEETEAWRPRDGSGYVKNEQARLSEFRAAVRANRQLAVALRAQGLNEHADRFAYRAQLLQRQVLRRQRHYGRAFGSWLLDLTSGYGYKPLRSAVTYLLVIFGFAVAYYLLGNNVSPALDVHGAVVFSLTSFHGRGFAPGGSLSPDNALTTLAAIEAVIGLLIEVTFIATFTQRFFAK